MAGLEVALQRRPAANRDRRGGPTDGGAHRPAHGARGRGRRVYRDAIGLPEIRGFRGHEGDDGVFLGLPGTAAHLGVGRALTAADIGNLRFYQRLGFRLRSVEPDALTEATGDAPGIEVEESSCAAGPGSTARPTFAAVDRVDRARPVCPRGPDPARLVGGVRSRSGAGLWTFARRRRRPALR